MQLSNVEPAYIEKYSKALAEAKDAKTEAALNKVFFIIYSRNFIRLYFILSLIFQFIQCYLVS